MIGVRELEEIVKTCVLTGRVRGERPISIFLISEPEHGKTTIVTENGSKSIIQCTDVTGSGLMDVCKLHPEISHLVVNDLTAIAGHSNRAQTFFYSMLTAMIEEGIQASFTPAGPQSFQHGKRAIIACTTPELAKDKRRWWIRTGLSSRLIPINYSYPNSLVFKIQNSYFQSSVNGNKRQPFKVPDIPLAVKCGQKWADEIIRLADSVSEKLSEIGIRKTQQFRTLAMAHALLRGWKNAEVRQVDITFLKMMIEYMSWDTPKIL